MSRKKESVVEIIVTKRKERRLMCDKFSQDGCKHGTSCKFAHTLQSQTIDLDKRTAYYLIFNRDKSIRADSSDRLLSSSGTRVSQKNLDSSSLEEINLAESKEVYTEFLRLTKKCKLCFAGKCIGGYNCRNGACTNEVYLCRNDLLSGNCNGCDAIHLTEFGLIPYKKRKNENYSKTTLGNKSKSQSNSSDSDTHSQAGEETLGSVINKKSPKLSNDTDDSDNSSSDELTLGKQLGIKKTDNYSKNKQRDNEGSRNGYSNGFKKFRQGPRRFGWGRNDYKETEYTRETRERQQQELDYDKETGFHKSKMKNDENRVIVHASPDIGKMQKLSGSWAKGAPEINKKEDSDDESESSQSQKQPEVDHTPQTNFKPGPLPVIKDELHSKPTDGNESNDDLDIVAGMQDDDHSDHHETTDPQEGND